MFFARHYRDITHWSLMGWTRGQLQWSLNYRPWLWRASCQRFNKMPSDTVHHRACQDTGIWCQHCPEPQRIVWRAFIWPLQQSKWGAGICFNMSVYPPTHTYTLSKLGTGHWHWGRGGRGNSWLQPWQHGHGMTTALLVASRTPADPLPGSLSHWCLHH